MASVFEIKRLLEKLNLLFDKVEEMGGKPEGLEDTSLKELFSVEAHSFFMYLASSDGKITNSEKDFMNTLFDTNISIQDYVKFINDKNIYSTSFENRFPLSLKILVLFDAKMTILATLSGEEYEAMTPCIIKFYLEAGKAFIACDGDVDNQEIEDLKTYVSKLADAAANLIGGDSIEEDDSDEEEVGYIGGKKGADNNFDETVDNSGLEDSEITTYPESIYKVGVDIPEGKYKLFVDYGRAYYAVCSDPNCDDIIENDNFYNQAYIDIHNGQYVDLSRCTAIPLEEAPMFNGTVYTSGEYLVGREIPAGEYKIQADDGYRGYYALETFEGDGSRDIFTNDNFSNAAYVKASEGQILVLSRCSIRR